MVLARDEEQRLVLEVRDTGIGIEEPIRAHLFERGRTGNHLSHSIRSGEIRRRGGGHHVLTREIRSSEKWRHLPIIATTAHAFPEDRERVMAAGCNAYLAKPFDHRDLLSKIAALLRRP